MIHFFVYYFDKDSRKEVYYIAIIDVLTNYGARKRAAHAAKTMKHGVRKKKL